MMLLQDSPHYPDQALYADLDLWLWLNFNLEIELCYIEKLIDGHRPIIKVTSLGNILYLMTIPTPEIWSIDLDLNTYISVMANIEMDASEWINACVKYAPEDVLPESIHIPKCQKHRYLDDLIEYDDVFHGYFCPYCHEPVEFVHYLTALDELAIRTTS